MKTKKIKCLSCGDECDPIDRDKMFGKTTTLMQHVCIKCREEIRQERAKDQETYFKNNMERLEKRDSEPARVRIDKKHAKLKAATDALAERKIRDELDDFIGL